MEDINQVPEEERMSEQDDQKKPSYILGLGASAGGLEALITFFDHMPSDAGMAFVVIQHLSPDHKSLMNELLARHTTMEILHVEDGMMLRPNRIYLIPPKKNLTVFNQRLLLTDQNHSQGLNLPIDVFFRSIAEDQQEKGIGIIFSGTGSDGTRGIQAIKKAGGMVIVQDEKSAKFDGMPRSAIATGMVDYICPPEDMPDVILRYTSHPLITKKKNHLPPISSEETDMTKIIAMLRSRTGVDFTYYKPSTVIRRLERRMGIVQKNTLREYLNHLYDNPEEINSLYKDLLIGVTKFFRDHDEFLYLRDEIIPTIFENNRKQKSIRVWIAGCSTGEEAFTIAISLQDYMDSIHERYEIKVFATDIDKDAIEKASLGYYPSGIAADLAPNMLEKYFIQTDDGYKVKRHIRELVIFASQNILRDPPFTKLDLITCRNLLIYFQPNLQKDVMAIFHFALKDRGYLFLGTSESVGNMSENFVSVDSKVKIFLHRGQGVPPIKDTLRLSSSASFYKNRIIATADPNAMNVNPAKQLEAQERYYQEIINELAPSCAVVKEDGTLVETFGRPDVFLRPQVGKVNFDIKKMVPPELSLVLTTGIRNALKDRKRIVYKNVRLKDEEYFRSANINISPLMTSSSDNRRVLIAFEEAPPSPEECSSFNFEARADQHLIDLEKEIQFTKENLQATIEELQTSNEELQATNEELLASNEELQSTNEELNSVNEELNTVNAEYQSKITELSELNNDMDNLFRSTEIGTIFLDRELRIRKFTPAVTKEINLLRQDIGRPLSDLSSSLLAKIYEDVRKVSDTSAKIEKTIQAEDPDVWYLIQILPYLNEKGSMGGVVVALVNITSQKKIEKAFEMQYDLLKRILETSPAATIMVNQQGEINFVNKQAETILGFQRDNLLKMRIDSPELNITDLEGHLISDENMPLETIRKTKQQIDKYVMCIHKADGHQVVLSVNGNPIFNEKNEVDGAVFKFEKVAELNKN